MNEDVKKLIEQLRRDAGDYGRYVRGEIADGEIVSWDQRCVREWEAADALEAAYTPVEGEQEKLIEKWIKREDGLRESADRYAGYFGGQFAEVQRCRAEFEAAFPTLGREAEIRADERERIIADLIGPATRLDATVRAFKQGWHLADSQGRTGERVQEGLQTVVSDRIRRYGREADHV